jgi:hypothetical protein
VESAAEFEDFAVGFGPLPFPSFAQDICKRTPPQMVVKCMGATRYRLACIILPGNLEWGASITVLKKNNLM